MEALYKAYKDNEKVAMYLVYVNEAHPARTTAAKSEGPSSVGKHKSMDEKVLAASKCMEGLKMTLPILIDGMDIISFVELVQANDGQGTPCIPPEPVGGCCLPDV